MLEAYARERFYPGIPNIVASVFGDFENTNIPPLVAARIDVKSFIESAIRGPDPKSISRYWPAIRVDQLTHGWDGIGTKFHGRLVVLWESDLSICSLNREVLGARRQHPCMTSNPAISVRSRP
jgi:hypothetical protein